VKESKKGEVKGKGKGKEMENLAPRSFLKVGAYESWSVHTYAALGCAGLGCAALGCAALS